MQNILAQKILLKNYTQLHLGIFILLIIILPIIININIDSAIITGLEQSLFIVLSAILFVFNDSVVGYKTVTKIRNTLDKLSKPEIKNKVLEAIGSTNGSVYEEFLAQTKGQIAKFNKVIYKFKKKSYQFYILFSFLGLMALFITLIERDSLIVALIVSLFEQPSDIYNTLSYLKAYIVEISIVTQFLLIIIWIISAIQAEKQKANLLNYLDGTNAISNVKAYIDNKNNIDIATSFSELVELDD
jgi:hypothetical protein